MEYFLPGIPKEARILDVGCGEGWVGDYLKAHGWNKYTGLDLNPPADIVGDIRDWRELGISESDFDVVMAFELVEHIDCFFEFHNILRPGGLLILTSPVPHMDWLLRIFEIIGLNQKRTGPHAHLIYFKNIPFFKIKELKIVGFMSQWAILQNLKSA